MKKKNHYDMIIDELIELRDMFPGFSFGMHISSALSEYGDLWDVTDKEILYAIRKYKASIENEMGHIL
jgi:hypothetical protein